MKEKVNLGHWKTVNGVKFDETAHSFVYMITCPNGKKYIGKKNMKKIIKRKPLKGKKRKRLCEVETNWREYTSSSNIINEDIKKNGKSGYKFEILRMTYSKFECAYFETKIQFEKNVLFNDEYLNGIINCRLGKVPNELQKRFDENGCL